MSLKHIFGFCFQLVHLEKACWESAWWEFELYCSSLTQLTGQKKLKVERFVTSLELKSEAEDQLKTGFETEIFEVQRLCES